MAFMVQPPLPPGANRKAKRGPDLFGRVFDPFGSGAMKGFHEGPIGPSSALGWTQNLAPLCLCWEVPAGARGRGREQTRRKANMGWASKTAGSRTDGKPTISKGTL